MLDSIIFKAQLIWPWTETNHVWCWQQPPSLFFMSHYRLVQPGCSWLCPGRITHHEAEQLTQVKNHKHTPEHHTEHKGLTRRVCELSCPPIIHSPLEWTVLWIHVTCICVCEWVTESVCVCLCASPSAIYIEPRGLRRRVLQDRPSFGYRACDFQILDT